jgi:hypothetical protein
MELWLLDQPASQFDQGADPHPGCPFHLLPGCFAGSSRAGDVEMSPLAFSGVLSQEHRGGDCSPVAAARDVLEIGHI